MAPKPRGAKSSAVVPTGPKHLWHDRGQGSSRKLGGIKPSTERALVLRNGKHGVQGTGEVIMFNKMQGREKLELLAEDLMQKTAQALGVRIDLEKCEKIAGSQFYAGMDDINDLQDPDLFLEIARSEIEARKHAKEDPYKNPTKVAETIAAMIHNSYILASGWKIVYQYLRQIRRAGVEDSSIQAQMKDNEELRTKYLVMYDVVNILTTLSQSRLSLLATSSPHFQGYFTRNNYEKDEPEYVFNWERLKSVQKSFLDSIVIELCLPRSRYPKNILYLLLRDAIDEASKKTKDFFPQALWDAVGDLSVAVQLQEMLESILLGPQGEKWKQEIGHLQLPAEYDDWLDAQALPPNMKLYVANWKDMIFPLERTRSRNVLDDMWRYINLNYEAFTGKDIDALWHVEEVHQRTPQWHAFKVDATGAKLGTDEPPALVPFKGKKAGKNQKGPGGKLALTNGDDGDDSDGSMPSLQTVSDSSEAETDYDSDDDDSDEDDVEYDEDENYDEEDEDMLREMEREAMDAASTDPDFYNPNAPASEFDELAEDRKNNPFIKLLGALRGRMFSGDPTLKSGKRAQPTRAFPGGTPPPAGKAPPRPATKPSAKSQKATVEEVEDEEEGGLPSASKKKKKKKPKKKKKKPTEGAEVAEGDAAATPSTTQPTTPGATTPGASSSVPAKKETPKPKPKPAARPPSIASSINAMPFGGSTTSLAVPTVAQSARKYMQEEGIEEKSKLKSRPDFGNLAPISEKKGFFSKLRKDKEEEQVPKGDKHSFFSTLSKKTKSYMHQLMNTSEDEKKGLAPMKWENFLKVMREMGFKYDPSTAGSSVRFDPPGDKDHPITFHKPHPDPTLQPLILKQFGKRLKRTYGWSEEDFYRRLS
ncbi:hypothetical protein QCA50_011534 [Cerrena zonata]|uniref:Uncharacterized protein n=1 Tax=Cerrena zonata TaxID=2478898 RepID=A0AAW0G675_9APHY